ncbi:MAG TPA: hypothetical protein VGX03_08365 [Candidatus Binatia bacterium]|nr:hypothetical protein [Candidatus Binatia bacterium]
MSSKQVSLFSVILLIFLIPCGCSYPQQRWKEFRKEFNEKVKRTAEEPKTPEGKCQRQGGVLYNGQCYTPSANSPALDENTCHMRGGLYIEERCLVAPKERASF